MDIIINELNKLMEGVMSKMEVLEGTEFAECKDDVRIELSNRLEDIKNMIQSASEKGKVKVNPKNLVLTQEKEGKTFRVCFTAMKVTGSGTGANGGIGVTWGEKTPINIGAKVVTNTVTQETARMWCLVVAAEIAEARKYPGIIVVDDNPSACSKIVQDVRSGKMDGRKDIEVLVKKMKESCGKVEIEIARGADKELFEMTGKPAKGEAKKIADRMHEDAKKEKRT